eukprot:3771887-Prymnesium_polylepis.1
MSSFCVPLFASDRIHGSAPAEAWPSNSLRLRTPHSTSLISRTASAPISLRSRKAKATPASSNPRASCVHCASVNLISPRLIAHTPDAAMKSSRTRNPSGRRPGPSAPRRAQTGAAPAGARARGGRPSPCAAPVSYTHLRAHETLMNL